MRLMDTTISKYKKCCVKIITKVCGCETFASGVIYKNPNHFDYDYILTAQHTFWEEGCSSINFQRFNQVEILYDNESELKELYKIEDKDIVNAFIQFDTDFLVIKIPKMNIENAKLELPEILLSKYLASRSSKFFSWSIFSANQDSINYFEYKRNDTSVGRFKLETNSNNINNYVGMSGSGIFSYHSGILYGIISISPNKDFENNIIECSSFNIKEINSHLRKQGLAELSTRNKRTIGNNIVNINEIKLNNTILDFDLAIKRCKYDIMDDWFIDPLRYIDLLNWNYVYEQFETAIKSGKYQPSKLERFFIPKKERCLRQALIIPFPDRLYYMALVEVLAPKLDKSLINGVYSARFNPDKDGCQIIHGVEQWRKYKFHVAENILTSDCIIEIDLLNFYDNIGKKLLIDKINRVCTTENEIAASKSLGNLLNKFTESKNGLPQNSDSSSILATFFLNQVDVYMETLTSKRYIRFMDDIRIFCSDKYEARKFFLEIETELRRCGLAMNSQKSKIVNITTEKQKEEYLLGLDLYSTELSKILKLANSHNFTYLNEAFHATEKLLSKNLEEELYETKSGAITLKFCLNLLMKLSNNINAISTSNQLMDKLYSLVEKLDDTPWITPQICGVLMSLPYEWITDNIWKRLSELVSDNRLNIYCWQTYHIWMLLAFHKYETLHLKQYALKNIEKNNQTQLPAIAAMIIYLGTVDDNYKRIILRKHSECFSIGYFQNRATLIALRGFNPILLENCRSHEKLTLAHKFLYRNKDKALVFSPGIEPENRINDTIFEQLYSFS